MRLSEMFKEKSQQQMSKDSLNKYKKKLPKQQRPQNFQKLATSSTTKNQFQKYFLDTVNVFFEDRQTLKSLQQTKIKLRIFLPVWFILAIVYIAASKIHPFEGVCPQHATCKVFIRCNPGYELSEDGKRCNVKASIIEQIQSVCKFEIQTLKFEYGDSDCLQNVSNPVAPYRQATELIDSITKTMDFKLSTIISQKIHSFLNNPTNKIQYDFEFTLGKVIPLSKKHSFRCWLSLSSQTTQFRVIGVIFVLLCILGGWYYTVYKRSRKVKQIYDYLKRKVEEENKVNITLLNDQIKLDFGTIDQNIWMKIDEERQKEGKIGYFQDEFLFWKLM